MDWLDDLGCQAGQGIGLASGFPSHGWFFKGRNTRLQLNPDGKSPPQKIFHAAILRKILARLLAGTIPATCCGARGGK